MIKERIIFHVDVNNAFLSWSAVKLLNEGYKVDIRKIASVIAGDETKRHGIVLAKSPVAKKYGIKTAETLFSARKKCKKLKIFPLERDWYEICSKKLFDYLSRYTPNIEIFSIDECFLDLSGTKYLYNDLVGLAYKIKNEIYDIFGFTVNVGIGNNKLCAKMASDFEKPDKVHTLYKHEIDKKLWPLDVSELFMVGKKTSSMLYKLGINTIGDLAKADLLVLKKYFKSQAEIMIEYANGIDDSQVCNSNCVNKGMSTSQTLEKDTDDINFLKNILLVQSKKLAYLLRKSNLYCDTVVVMIKTFDFRKITKQGKLSSSTSNSDEIYDKVLKLFINLWEGSKIRNIGIRVTGFSEQKKQQLSLFEGYSTETNSILEKVLDNINDKYGNNSIVIASLLENEAD